MKGLFLFMPRRFTDTDKWRDEWWGSLDNDYRMIWLYLIDSCSIAGIWKKDFRGLNFNCNTKVTEAQFIEVFGSRVIDRGNFFFIPKFLRYQNPKGLKSNKPAVVSIIKELELNNLTPIINESLGNDFLIVKGIGKGKGIGKEREREQVNTKLDIFEKLFSDEQYVEQLALAHKGKSLNQAFEEMYIHFSNAPNPPQELSEWRQKLNTWLANTKTNGNSKNGKQTTSDLAAALQQRIMQDAIKQQPSGSG